MHYTPAQVKEALEITEETLRHWRRSLPPLQDKRGYSPCFSPGDLLALCVVARLHGLGISVSQLKGHSEKLFGACSQSPWFGLEDKSVVFDGESIDLVGAVPDAHWLQKVRITAPLGPLIRQLRQRLLDEEPVSTQAEIPFPPMEISRGGGK